MSWTKRENVIMADTYLWDNEKTGLTCAVIKSATSPLWIVKVFGTKLSDNRIALKDKWFHLREEAIKFAKKWMNSNR